MASTDRIEVNPMIMLGKPVIRGTRIPVELIVRKLGEGASERDLLDGYPELTPEAIRAALIYAADSLALEEGDPARRTWGVPARVAAEPDWDLIPSSSQPRSISVHSVHGSVTTSTRSSQSRPHGSPTRST